MKFIDQKTRDEIREDVYRNLAGMDKATAATAAITLALLDTADILQMRLNEKC